MAKESHHALSTAFVVRSIAEEMKEATKNPGSCEGIRLGSNLPLVTDYRRRGGQSHSHLPAFLPQTATNQGLTVYLTLNQEPGTQL